MAPKQAGLESEWSVLLSDDAIVILMLNAIDFLGNFRFMDQWWIINLLTIEQGGSEKYQRSFHGLTNASETEASTKFFSHPSAID